MAGRKPASTVRWQADQFVLIVAGVVSFVLGASVHSGKANLSVALVALGAALVVIAALLPRLKSISGKVAGIEFAASLVTEPVITRDRELLPPVGPNQAVNDPRGAGWPSDGAGGFAKAVVGPRADLVVIDLEDGQAWLTSRLLIFIATLIELREIEVVVFVHNENGGSVFVGTAPAHRVVERLSWSMPWLAVSLASAWQAVAPSDLLDRLALPVAKCIELFSTFGDALISDTEPAESGEQWTKTGSNRWEHARWLRPKTVRILLGEDLSAKHVVQSEIFNKGRRAADRAALKLTTVRFVAVLTPAREFERLVDRLVLLDAAGEGSDGG